MKPILLYINAARIDREKDALSALAGIYQNIYSAVVEVGVENPTVPEINQLIVKATRRDPSKYVEAYISQKLVDKALPGANMNGVQMSREAIAGMVQVPNVSAIYAVLQPFNRNGQISGLLGGFSPRVASYALLTIENNEVVPSPDAEGKIEAAHTSYTSTDQSTALTTQLQTVCDVLNTFSRANGNVYLTRIPIAVAHHDMDYLSTEIPGIGISGSSFIVDERYVKRFERDGYLPGATDKKQGPSITEAP